MSHRTRRASAIVAIFMPSHWHFRRRCCHLDKVIYYRALDAFCGRNTTWNTPAFTSAQRIIWHAISRNHPSHIIIITIIISANIMRSLLCEWADPLSGLGIAPSHSVRQGNAIGCVSVCVADFNWSNVLTMSQSRMKYLHDHIVSFRFGVETTKSSPLFFRPGTVRIESQSNWIICIRFVRIR